MDEWDTIPLAFQSEICLSPVIYPYTVVDIEIEKTLSGLSIIQSRGLKKAGISELPLLYASRHYTTVKLLSTKRQISSEALKSIRSLTASEDAPSYQSILHSSNLPKYLRVFAESLVKRIGPILQSPNIFSDDSKKISLMKMPTLLSAQSSQSDISQNYLSQVFKSCLSHCATIFPATVVSIDARQLIYYESFSRASSDSQHSTNFTSPSSSSNAPLKNSRQNQTNSVLQSIQSAIESDTSNLSLTSEFIELILQKVPCLLLIESLDSLLDDDIQLKAHSVPLSNEDKFFRAFTSFLSDLYSDIAAAAGRAGGAAAGMNNDLVDDVLDCVMVFVGTASESRLKPSSKAIFSSTFRLDISQDSSAVDEELRLQLDGDNIVWQENRIVFQDERTKDLFCRSAAKYLNTSSGMTTMEMMVNEFRLETLKYYRSSSWLQNSGYQSFETNKNGSQNPHDNDNDNDEQLRIVATQRDVRRYFMDRKSSRAATAGSAVESAQTFSVHWTDIGGLDEVRREILDVLELPFQYPELFRTSCPRRQGVLLYGPPG